jgi:predicted kinase
MPTLHLMHGFIGSGKTTYAKKLEADLPALRLNNDEWMVALFGVNPPQESFSSHYEAIKELQLDMAERVLVLGRDVILDYGFWSLAWRNEVRQKAMQWGVPFRFYAMITPIEECRRRVLARTEALPHGNLVIDANAFDELWQRFEPMGEDEVKVLV